MPEFADDDFDVVITDPPFSERTHANLGKERRSDGATDRGELGFSPVTKDLVLKVSAELCRLAKRWIIVFGDEFSVPLWASSIEAAGGQYVRRGTWVKTDPMPQMSGDRPGQGTEDFAICHAPRVSGRMQWNGGGRAATYTGPCQERDVRRVHKTQKPLWLMEALVRDFTERGERVLDPFCGSGTTGVACRRTGRLFVGIELDEASFRAAQARLAVSREQFDLFG